MVLVPNSSTFSISKRLHEKERKRLRQILEKAKPAEHGIIARTAENITKQEIQLDVDRLVAQWKTIEDLARKASAPTPFASRAGNAVSALFVKNLISSTGLLL